MAFSIDSRGLSLGLFLPLAAYRGAVPDMQGHLERALQAESLGFRALWFRDVPLQVPGFGDVGQIHDPWVYMAYLAARTERIGLAAGSIILPLRHPIHTAKSAASIDVLSQGRVALGVASGDRPEEFPAFGRDLRKRSELFRQSFASVRTLWQESFPVIDAPEFGHLDGTAGLLPKPWHRSTIPMYVTGHAGQDLDWIARHADGWIYFPLGLKALQGRMLQYRAALDRQNQPRKPYLQSLYIDLLEDPGADPEPIHLGFRCGRRFLLDHLKRLEVMGVNHVMLVLRFCSRPIEEVIEEIGREVLPHCER